MRIQKNEKLINTNALNYLKKSVIIDKLKYILIPETKTNAS